ncbi:hypothetical protein HGG76_05975 [Ochrobactrum tritici]|uniref:Uncharacterized protein n=1 Tax=Brucella tritici TaxID=94626 RepID=A0A7X6FPH0_9HYPH|nr:hypothetical protein [Brucella tritici]
MDSIAINSETFTPEGRDAGGLEIGELELLFQGVGSRRVRAGSTTAISKSPVLSGITGPAISHGGQPYCIVP